MKIGIIGLGLIGGSILKALQDKGHELFAVSKSSYKKASNLATTSDDLNILRECELIFVCCEMSKALDTLNSLKGIANGLVCDVCSLKQFVQNDYPFEFIGTHPMAGTEFSGFEASFSELFQGATWVITKHNETLVDIIKSMGAKPILAQAKEHDFAAALISHLPMFTSFALVKNMEENELAKALASSGFRDSTRLALTNSTLASDMLNMNEENINLALDGLIKQFEHLKNLSVDEKIKELQEISKFRLGMYDSKGKRNN